MSQNPTSNSQHPIPTEPRATGYELRVTRTVLRATCYALAIALTACATTRGYSPDMVLARVDDEPITVQDLEEAFTGSHKGHGIFLAGKGAVRQFLEKVIDKRLLLQEARRIGLDQDAEIEQAIEQLRAKRAASEFYRDQVEGQVEISEEAIVAAHQQLGDRFEARHILVASREEAEGALARIGDEEEFAEVAQQVSLSSTANKGGYLGIIKWGQLDPKLEEKLWTLAAGEVSEPFETDEEWNLLYVIERTSGDPPDLERTKSRIRAVLEKRERKRRADALFWDLMGHWDGRIDEAVLREIVNARKGQELAPATVVAEVADQKITVAQLLRRMDLNKVRKLPKARAVTQMRWLLEDQLFNVLLRKEALARGFGERPGIQRELERVRDKLAVDLLLNKVVFARLEVSNEEVVEYYQTHSQDFTEPEAVNVSIILVESEEEARAVMDELQNGQDFAVLARNVSRDPMSASVGGEVGWLRKGQMTPELEKVTFALQERETGIARVQAGYAVIRVEEKKETRLKPFAEVQEQARKAVLRRKSQQTLKEWVTKLREASVIVVDDEAINRAIASYDAELREKAGVE